MTPLTEALDQILGDAQLLAGTENVCLPDALGRVLAVDQFAAADVPPWNNSAMDGFAIRSRDLDVIPGTFLVSQRIAAGSVGDELSPGCVAQIFTGAPMPPGADAVIMQEDTTRVGNQVRCHARVREGDNVRPRGQDIASGQLVLERGRRLQPQDLGVLASVGKPAVLVAREPVVGLLSTGNELQEPGAPLGSGQIYNSNRYVLMGLLKAIGLSWRDYGVVDDDLEITEQVLSRAASECDLLVSTGGVSVGEEDHVRAAVSSLGELKLWKLAIKPGKPLAYGRVGTTPYFGLPGNPAASFVTFGLIVKPYLSALQGCRDCMHRELVVRAGFDWNRPGRRREFLRARLQLTDAGEQTVQVFENQSSGVLSLISQSDCLVDMPAYATCRKGDVVKVILLKDWVY